MLFEEKSKVAVNKTESLYSWCFCSRAELTFLWFSLWDLSLCFCVSGADNVLYLLEILLGRTWNYMWEKLRSRRHVGKLRAEMSVMCDMHKKKAETDFILVLSSTCGCPINHWMPSQASHQQPSLKSFKRNINTFLPTPWLFLVPSHSTSDLERSGCFLMPSLSFTSRQMTYFLNCWGICICPLFSCRNH